MNKQPKASACAATPRENNARKRGSTTYRFALAILMSNLAMAGHGQESENKKEEIFELSPFEVNSSNDSGYVAENTLSGTRLNTAVKDLATTMSILTEQFWDDTAASSVNDMLIYTPGAERSDTQFGGGNARSQFWGDNTIFRGVQVENIVRNQFRSNIPSDTYNASRFEISRGPNAVLFGVTREPAGLVNRTTKDATFSNSNEAEIRIDEHGSLRASIGLNRVLIEDVLSARIDLLSDEQDHWIEPGFQDQRRIYSAINYTPNDKLSVKFRTEHMTWDRAAVDPSVGSDRVSAWIAAGRPGVDISASEDIPAESYPSGTARMTSVNQVAFVNDGSGRMINLRNFAQGDITRLINGSAASLPLEFAPLDFNFFGTAGSQYFSGRNYQGVVQYRASEKVNLEFAYNDEFMLYDFIAAGNSNLFVDANTTLDDGITENPHFGDYFALATPSFRLKQDRYLRGARLSGSVRHDFAENDRFAWLGKHDFVAMLEQNTDEFYWDVLRLIPEGTAAADESATLGRVITYVDLENKELSGPTWSRDFQSMLNSVPGNNYSWQNGINGSGITNNRTEIDSALFVWQGRFWDDRIVPTLGWRQDEIYQYSTSPAPDTGGEEVRFTAREIGYAIDTLNSGAKPNTANQGIVFHAIENAGPIDHFSLFFNRADSFAASNFNLRPDNSTLPAKTGETEDFGFRFGLMDGKISGVFTIFDMDVKNSTASVSWRPVWFALDDLFGAVGINEYHDIAQVSDTQDLKSEGWEFQLTGNITRNWRIMFGVDHYKTFDSNVVPVTLDLIDEYGPTFQSNAAVIVPDREEEITVGELYDQMLTDLALQLAQVGGYKNNERQYKSTLLTSYSFSDGAMKGISFGGNAIWRDKPATGFAFREDPELGLVVDADNPFFGEDSFNVGLHASYERKILKDSVDWKVQLNINNIGDEDPFVTRHTVAASAPTTPIVQTYSRGNPQTLVLTNTFRW
ncbi:TonB-dependent receptor plug domain-containing protein [Pelagicoccus sp. SDUM812003]|uniref:TonB-dependent receptor plug domain-containing protein n=1 Tax=Pelagicoccus sp. SDUM812003 TaxID=3041267 RepID=UPI00280C8191|nr:TonB-dependent receptor plug domain-containing protein [Pelagicoccus sp. SDUM812003]MDQ8201436.1 hypothetical protein [Pelagicoccus sp. SDUM812003]